MDQRPYDPTRRALLHLLIAAPGPLLMAACSRESAPPPPVPSGSIAASSGSPSPSPDALSCVVRPSQALGPYFIEDRLNRSDIRTDPSTGVTSPGLPLDLTFRVYQVRGTGCSPLPSAVVDVWHCDASGIYSDVRDPTFNTVGQKFLRGFQHTDQAGAARFTTIYPGWYQGRAVHVHFRVRTEPASPAGHDFVSQLYFDESVTDRVHVQQPYAEKSQNRVRNDRDSLFRNGGQQLLLHPVERSGGYAATFDLGLRLA